MSWLYGKPTNAQSALSVRTFIICGRSLTLYENQSSNRAGAYHLYSSLYSSVFYMSQVTDQAYESE